MLDKPFQVDWFLFITVASTEHLSRDASLALLSNPASTCYTGGGSLSAPVSCLQDPNAITYVYNF